MARRRGATMATRDVRRAQAFALLLGVALLAACNRDDAPTAVAATPAPTVGEVANGQVTLRFMALTDATQANADVNLSHRLVAHFELVNAADAPRMVFGEDQAGGFFVADPMARLERRLPDGRWETPFDYAAAPVPPDSVLLGPQGRQHIAMALPTATSQPPHAGSQWRVCVALDAVQEVCSDAFAVEVTAPAR